MAYAHDHRFCLILILGFTFSFSLSAQIIPIETAHSALVLNVTKDKLVKQIYLGDKLGAKEEYFSAKAQRLQASDPSGVSDVALSTSGSRNLFEPAVSVRHSDGNQSLTLKFVKSSIEKLTDDIRLTTLLLKDPVYNFEVKLFYKAYIKDDVIEQWTEIVHHEDGPVILQKFASANLYWAGKSFWLKQYHGDWGREMQPEQQQLTHGIKTLDTKLGARADLFMPPVFMVSLDKPATEDAGVVLLGSMEWSGNFKIDLELDNRDNLRIIAGMNNYASNYQLKPGEIFKTPKFLYTISNNGKGQASRQLQDWARSYQLLDGEGQRSTLLNNWESTHFDFDESKLKGLLADTKALGVDLFLLDDGWFANKYPRNDDHAGLGDWQPNKKKLPHGIKAIIQEADQIGVKFGIWIEPEMVSPKSELYETHPDWVIKQPNRPEYYFRHQLVLDLSNPKVQDLVFGIVDSLFIKNPDLAYIKWDCNSVIYNAYSAHLKDQGHFYIDYVRGLYKVLKRVREKYPKVPMMLCSGGGGRVDYGALAYFTEYWPSDNTDPLERIFIQWEYSYFYPAIASANHVTNWGKQPLKFKIDVAMMGKLGFDIPFHELASKDKSFCQQAVKTYDKIKNIVWHGEQYRLSSPWTNDVASLMYVNNTRSAAVVFSYLVSDRYASGSKLPIKWKGLDPSKTYKIEELNLYPDQSAPSPINKQSDRLYSGDFLMKVGFNPVINDSRHSVVLSARSMD